MSCRCQGTQSNCITEPFNANFVRPLQYVRGVDDNGCVSYTPVTSFALNVQDTNTLDLAFSNGIISGNVRISGAAGNQIQALADGLFVSSTSINVQDTPTIDLTLTATNVLSADVNVSAQTGNAVQVLSDGLFVGQINVQDTPTVDLTLSPTNDLSANVNVSAQPGNAVQVLFDGLFVGQINVQDTPTVDLTLTATNDLSADVNVSSQPGNAVQVLPDGLFVNSINVQDTPTVDLTLTPTNDLSADVNVSAQAGNAVQVLSDGLFVAQINVQDTPTVDLTLTPTNDLSADVNVSAQAGNAVQVLSDGLFVAQINVQDTPTVDLTLTPTNDLSADVNVSAQAGNAVQVLSDGLFVAQINVQDTPTVDLTLTPTNDLSADVNVSTQAGNAIQVLPDGLFVSSNSINVQDTPTVDLTLTPTNDLSADVNVSAQPGNAIQILTDGLFVSSTSINVQDTPTVDLTLTAGNVLSANVNISAQTGNGLQVLADGLYIPSTSNPCLTNPPNLVSFPTNDLLAAYNANTGCLEQIAVPSECIVYGEPSGNGSPRADNLRYSPSNNFLRATFGFDFPMQNSFAIYGTGVNVSGLCYSLIGSFSNSNIQSNIFSILNLDNSNNVNSFGSVLVGRDFNNVDSHNSVLVGTGLTLGVNETVFESAILFRNLSIITAYRCFISAFESSIGETVGSFIVASDSYLSGPYHSFVNANGVNYRGVTCSLSIAYASPPSANQPHLQFSTHISRNTSVVSGTPFIIYSNAIFDSVNIIGNLHIYQSTVHLEDVTLSFDDISNRQYLLSFISARNSSLGRTEYSFFSGDINANQTPRILWSLVSTRPNNFNRNGPGTPNVRSSVVITANNLPDSLNSLLISDSTNTWLQLQRSVCVADNLQVFNSNPPNNTANLANSLIVGQGHNVSSISNINALTLVGSNLSAGTQTVFGVGINAYAPPAVINAGGWRAYIADGGADNANYFQGWASAWRFRMFRPSTNYANDADAVNALNTDYGADPRNAVGTMVVALVAGNPAIFTWNGTTFVRITV